MVISIIGPSGCGKGTQAKLLSQKLGLPAISTGELLRQEFEAKTTEGIAAEKYWGRGEWVPAELMLKILTKRLDRPDCKNGFILDGTPRKMTDIPLLDDYLSPKGQKLDLVFHLDTTDESCLSRIQGRVFRAKKEGKKVREDEDIDEVRERLKQYHETINPVLKYFEKKGILRRVNNEQPIEAVFAEILKALPPALI
jgi:adenylate kinase